MNICVKNKVNHNDGRVLILEATADGSDHLLKNLYNANTEREQLTKIKYLHNLLKSLEDFHDKNMIFEGEFNWIFDKNLESSGAGVPYPKNLLYPGLLN